MTRIIAATLAVALPLVGLLAATWSLLFLLLPVYYSNLDAHRGRLEMGLPLQGRRRPGAVRELPAQPISTGRSACAAAAEHLVRAGRSSGATGGDVGRSGIPQQTLHAQGERRRARADRAAALRRATRD